MAKIFQFPYRTVAEISLPALLKNLYTLRNLCGREIIPVIKADAYGHGMIPIARSLVQRGLCEQVAVATLEEAMDLRAQFRTGLSILVLSGFFPHQTEAYVKYRLVPLIHTLDHLRALGLYRTLPQVHLKIDTGMHRLGLTPAEVPEAIATVRSLGIKLAGLATHFAESENTVSAFTDQQLKEFESILSTFREQRLLHTDARIHVGNSGAILRGKLGSSNAVRPGLTLYGVSPNPRLTKGSDLVPVLQWKSRLLCTKELEKGDSIGYGRTYEVRRKEKMGIVPIGYADGYPRSLGNTGEVLIAGKRVPIRGRVSMDMLAVDCTHIAGAKEGMLVTLIGTQGKETIGAWELAQWSETIPYEIFCGLSPRVPRIYLD